MAAMKNIQSQSTSSPTSIAQVAAAAALNGDQACIQPMLMAFRQRHDHVVARLNAIQGMRCLPSQGTFYAFPSVQQIINAIEGINNDTELAEFILNETGVALVPGSAFGAEGHMRLSYATSMDNLNTALDRLQSLFGRIEI